MTGYRFIYHWDLQLLYKTFLYTNLRRKATDFFRLLKEHRTQLLYWKMNEKLALKCLTKTDNRNQPRTRLALQFYWSRPCSRRHEARHLFLLTTSRPVPGPNQHPVQWAPVGSFPGVKRSRYRTDYSPPSSGQAKNERSYTSDPPVWLHSVWRGNFNFPLFIKKKKSHYMHTNLNHFYTAMETSCILQIWKSIYRLAGSHSFQYSIPDRARYYTAFLEGIYSD